ncbi:flagellar motor switch protein FliM [Calderihabitans maritimus]|uniref:Flagellar motor switch protein FliM n=1 Tax=Calderihabitans maritimus TaxID=1246530 RepID=A0A1Z5HUE7_9FIRM|nr:flagellar motor switch protein FliM [Calderihabitans maritimus]GAW92951.1 flagellar motor switch protein FliM [Calderihabitans maritimus]
MKEVLTQAEIDLLLSAMSSGKVKAEDFKKEESEVKVKTYDFRRPNKFSKGQLRTLFMLHDNYARLLSNFLSAYLRTNVQIRMASVDQLTYEDFMVSIPSPTLMTVFSMPPLKGMAVLETNPEFIFPIIDLLFGGPGEMPEQIRELTDIEMGVLRKLNAKLLENLAYAWADIVEIETKIESLETNPQFNQIISPSETVAVVTMSTAIGNHKGLINLCLPYLTLETVISKLSAHFWLASLDSEQEGEQRSRIRRKIADAFVELTGVCGHAYITVRDFLQLQEGDVIPLDRAVGQDLDLYVEDKLKYKVQPGVMGRKLAVQITGFSNKEEEQE